MPTDHKTVTYALTPDDAIPQGPVEHVLQLVAEGARPFVLRGEATAVIGRGEEAELRIDAPWVSRRHAILHGGPTLRIEDLGSVNGTRVRDTPLAANQPLELHVGDLVQIGSSMIVVQRSSAEARGSNVVGRGDFEERLDAECARAGRYGLLFSLARIELLRAVPEETALGWVASVTRRADAVSALGAGEYEVLLAGYSGAEADGVVRRILDHVEARNVPCKVGIATFPRDGQTRKELLRAIRMESPGKSASVHPPPRVIVSDARMREVHSLVERVAVGRISVLLLGETGVGKEVLAEMVHRKSPRADKPFLRLNCGAFTESLLESELFGHERGAFTGALNAKPGLLETAQGGTVFLDEVGELPMSTQVKLLRVLEERQVRRVGAVKSFAIDVRFVAATNRDLEEDVKKGTFRQDLFFRLNGASVSIPPLRERVGEIEGLAKKFLEEACRQNDQENVPRLSTEALAVLQMQPWPGNIRELRNVMERAALMCAGDVILPEHFPFAKAEPGGGTMKMRALDADRVGTLRPPAAPEGVVEGDASDAADGGGMDLDAKLASVEKERILKALDACMQNQTRAAEMLGISRRRLIDRMEYYGMKRPRKK